MTSDVGEVALAAALDCVPLHSSAESQSRGEATVAAMIVVSAPPLVSLMFHTF